MRKYTRRWEELEPAGSVAPWTVRVPPKSLAGAWPTAKESGTEKEGDEKKPPRPIRPLNVLTRYRVGEEEHELSLRIKLPPTWDDKTVADAVIEVESEVREQERLRIQ